MDRRSGSEIPTVFLGGTCGGDLWRTPFEARLEELGVPFFNPQVDDWKPWMAEMENLCIRHSPMVLFPVLSSTLGLGSLGEIGFSIMSVLRDIVAGRNRELIILIDPVCDPDLEIRVKDAGGVARMEPAGPALVAESNRMRALVRSKVEAEIWRQGVHLVETLEEMRVVMGRLLACGHLNTARTYPAILEN